MVGIVVGVYLAVTLLVNIPFVQRWLANGVGTVLESVVGTRVDIGRVEIGWNGRIIVTNLVVDDQQGEEMLRVARVAARLGINELIHKRIRIGNAQLFGMHANLYQACEGCDPNFKFLIDAFASKDTTKHTPLDLRISQILVRRGHVKWEKRFKAPKQDQQQNQTESSKFDASHIELRDLNLTAQLNCLTDDSLNVRVKRFDGKEKSGLAVKALAFYLVGNKKGVTLKDFKLEMPNSSLEIPTFTSTFITPNSKPTPGEYSGSVKAHLSPTDFVALLPQLAEVKDVVDLNVNLRGEDDYVNITSLRLHNGERSLRLVGSGQAGRLRMGKDSLYASVYIQELYAESERLLPYIKGKEKLNEILNRLGSINLTGQINYDKANINGHIHAHTPLGMASVRGNGTTKGAIDVSLQSDGFQIGELLAKKELGLLAIDMKTKGTIAKHPQLTLTGRIPEMDYKGYRYRNMEVNQISIHNSQIAMNLACADPNASFEADGEVDLKGHAYRVKADINRLAPNTLNLTKRYVHTDFSGTLYADLTAKSLNDMEGVAQFNDFSMTDSTGTYRPGDIHMTARKQAGSQHLLLISPFLEAQVEGNIEPKVIVSQIKRMVSNYLPTANEVDNSKLKVESLTNGVNDAKRIQGAAKELTTFNSQPSTLNFTLRAYNAEPIRRLLGVPLTLTGITTANGEMDGEHNALWLNVKSPGLQYGNEHLRHIDLHLESNYESMLANLELQRQMKGKWISLGLDTKGYEGKLATRLFFNNKVDGEVPPDRNYSGDVNIISRLWRDIDGKQGFEGQVLESNFQISDTLWTVYPGFVTYHNGLLQVDSFKVGQGERFIRINGRASKSETDTLHAQLQRINLEYIFSLINFHAVELTGEATGNAYAHSLFSSPKADAYIRIPQFALNYGKLGDLDIHLNWGDRPYSIFLDGRIEEGQSQLAKDEMSLDVSTLPSVSRTLVKGYITPKKDIDYHGIDLNVNAERVNMEFINKWTSAIFDNLQGRATGWVHIFGPFKEINIEGDALVNEGSVGIPFIGVRYHLENDSIQLRPDNIYFTNAHLYDPFGDPGVNGHQALVSGHLHHDSFKNLSYDILVRGQNILGYNFTDFGDENFYGTVYATGDVTLKGHPGEVRIGIKTHPERGTTFTYNATSPDKLTETPFISYKSKVQRTWANQAETSVTSTNQAAEPDTKLIAQSNVSGVNSLEDKNGESKELSTQNDMYIDFDLDIDEESTMNLLMDARSGDKISINGSGHMLAHFYNKGSFDLYGTYRVSRGTYNLSLQEVIHKNFEFSPDGTLTFNGEPYGADLNLQAVHTVSGVSLNDINPKANFSNTTKRVNCLMNITGKAREPHITFDFDIPNANEEEKQMVRSLISTEEERNMQVIYLLGIGRFYAYDYTNQTQGTTAMNSLLSSTLSGTINQALSNMIGNSNWNFGANLRTGEMGWSDMDVEGMLQGNLLNNRLLINGNFGYRDNPMANSNFIGDFDVKYLLTRSGSVALKAYSETNDRYFTKSSLTTQGIGVLLKKDFTSWRDLIVKRKRKEKQ